MSAVWQYGPEDSIDRFILLAIADNANDDGVAWPSVTRLGAKCCLGERAMRYRLRRLEDEGWVQVEKGAGDHGTNRYTVIAERLKGGTAVQGHSGAGGTPVPLRGAPPFLQGGHPGAAESPEEPSVNHQGGARKRASLPPQGWQPTEKLRELASSLGFDADEQAERWVDYCHSKGKRYVGFEATYRNWLKQEAQYRDERQQRAASNGSRHLSAVPPRSTGSGVDGRPTSLDELSDADRQLADYWLQMHPLVPGEGLRNLRERDPEAYRAEVQEINRLRIADCLEQVWLGKA